jgi:hypothetical protein
MLHRSLDSQTIIATGLFPIGFIDFDDFDPNQINDSNT